MFPGPLMVTDSGGGPWLTKSSRLGEPVPGLPTTPIVVSATSWLRTCVAVQVGWAEAMSAAAPAACGVAIDVPSLTKVATLLVYQSEVIAVPGAKRSRHEPKLEYCPVVKWARLSLVSVAPTVIAAETRAGEKLQALWLSLPAATA